MKEKDFLIYRHQYHQQNSSGIWGTACFKHKPFCTTKSNNCRDITGWELLPSSSTCGAQTNQNGSIQFQSEIRLNPDVTVKFCEGNREVADGGIKYPNSSLLYWLKENRQRDKVWIETRFLSALIPSALCTYWAPWNQYGRMVSPPWTGAVPYSTSSLHKGFPVTIDSLEAQKLSTHCPQFLFSDT